MNKEICPKCDGMLVNMVIRCGKREKRVKGCPHCGYLQLVPPYLIEQELINGMAA